MRQSRDNPETSTMAAPIPQVGTDVRILLTGLHPSSVAKRVARIDTEALQQQLNDAYSEMNAAHNLKVDDCSLYYEDEGSPATRLAATLRTTKPYDGVIIGFGVRGWPENSWLLEECIEVVRKYAPPSTKLLFSTAPDDHLPTIIRNFPQVSPASK